MLKLHKVSKDIRKFPKQVEITRPKETGTGPPNTRKFYDKQGR